MSDTVSKAADLMPTDIALALFLYEGDRYNAITPTDCVSHLMQRPEQSVIERGGNVSEARDANNKITMWVKYRITKPDKLEERRQSLRFFVDTAFVSTEHSILFNSFD